MMTEVELRVDGMTCASCVTRVEKRLNLIDGVAAEVNLATERAHVRYEGDVASDELVRAVRDAGYDARLVEDAAQGDGDDGPDPLLGRLVASAALSVPVVAMAMIPFLQFPGWQWLSLVLATPVVLWGGWPFHKATAANLRHGAVTMDTLVTLGTGAAYAWSVVAVLDGLPVYLEVATGVTTILLLGRFIEHRSRRRAGAAVRALLELGAHEVSLLEPSGTETIERRVAVEQLPAGALFLVRPGEKIAADGRVVGGAASIDRAMLTGEAVPIDVAAGDRVEAGTIPHGGSITVRAERVGRDTALAHIARLVEQAQSGKGRAQRRADRVSAVFVPVVIGIAIATLVAWLLVSGSAAAALTAAISVLVIACPCALGLAVPMALLVGTGRGAQLGILVTGPDSIERARRVDTIALDKTGTLTDGRMSVLEVVAEDGDRGSLLALAASVESRSEHPIARAIVAAGANSAASGDEPGDFRARPGFGVEARVGGRRVLVGAPALMAEEGVQLTGRLGSALEDARDGAGTAIVVAIDGEAAGIIVVRDRVRPDARTALDALRARGIVPVLLTGDAEPAARRIAGELGIDEVLAGLLPGDKVEAVRRLAAEGRVVAMIGDGVNDSAAFAEAELGIAMGGGTDAAIAAADITLVRDELGAVVDAIRLSDRTVGVIRGNLFWAFAYNAAAIPLAALGLMEPMIAGAAMAFSSVFVVLNSLTLSRFRRSA